MAYEQKKGSGPLGERRMKKNYDSMRNSNGRRQPAKQKHEDNEKTFHDYEYKSKECSRVIETNSRVIILDDQEKRLNEKNVLERKKNEDADLASFHTINKTPDQDEKDVIITFGGCLAADGFS